MSFDIYMPVAMLLLMSLIATLRLSLKGVSPARGGLDRALAHPAWMVPLILLMPYVTGTYFRGLLSPWPPAAFDAISAQAGIWAGISAFITVLAVDIWLLWAPARVLAAHASLAQKPAVKYYFLINALLGLAFILLGLKFALNHDVVG